ncbi:hypothetical protein [Cytobacillus citreus]|uniref:hypothetical protein n=1 Tax=Cytobacillus citreus TaxID=2833586 RepID=UPI0030846056
MTAAGHLLAHETIYDGVREIKEELGIEVGFTDLISLEIIDYSVIKAELIDNEIAHVFLFKSQKTFADFRLQKEEVSGIVRAKFTDFCQLWLGGKSVITIEGFKINKSGENTLLKKNVDKNDFVPHDISYYETIIKLIKKEIKMMHG